MRAGLFISHLKYYGVFAAALSVALAGGFVHGFCEGSGAFKKARSSPKAFRNIFRIAAPVDIAYAAIDPLSDISLKLQRQMGLAASEFDGRDAAYLTDEKYGAVYEVRVKKRSVDAALEVSTKQIRGEPIALYAASLESYILRPAGDRACIVEVSTFAQFEHGYTPVGRFLARLASGLAVKCHLMKLKNEIEKNALDCLSSV